MQRFDSENFIATETPGLMAHRRFTASRLNLTPPVTVYITTPDGVETFRMHGDPLPHRRPGPKDLQAGRPGGRLLVPAAGEDVDFRWTLRASTDAGKYPLKETTHGDPGTGAPELR